MGILSEINKQFLSKCMKLRAYVYKRRIYNDNFTILCNSCIGGVMYHYCGKQFCSPTINLWMHDKDFYKFVNNLSYYINEKIKFIDSEDGTPVGMCGDITIYFNHYSSEEEAERKWSDRLLRMNLDNLFIVCSDRPYADENITYEQIASLKSIECKGRVVFSNRKYDDIDYLVPLPKDEGHDYVNIYMFDKNKLGRWRWETAWDWVHWLNTGEIKRK